MKARLYRFIFMALLLLTVIYSAYAQPRFAPAGAKPFGWGFKVGQNFSTLVGDVNKAQSTAFGFTFGGFAEFGLGHFISFTPELLYSRQGFRDHRLNYLNIPLLFNVWINYDGFRIKTGFQPSILLGAHKFDYKNDRQVIQGIQAYDFSIPLGFSYTSGVGFEAEIRYNLGLENILEYGKLNDNTRLKNSWVTLSFGWRF